MEAELESLLKEAEPDAPVYFPEVPTGGLRPSVPLQLEEDLSRLTLSDSGWYSGFFVCVGGSLFPGHCSSVMENLRSALNRHQRQEEDHAAAAARQLTAGDTEHFSFLSTKPMQCSAVQCSGTQVQFKSIFNCLH